MTIEAFERVTRYDGFLTMSLGVIPKPQRKPSLVSKDYAAQWVLPGSGGMGIASKCPSVSRDAHRDDGQERDRYGLPLKISGSKADNTPGWERWCGGEFFGDTARHIL